MDTIKPLFTASATATGGRNGHTEASDGSVKADLSVPKAMGGPGKPGTATPEHLFAAGYAACFGGALDYVAKAAPQGRDQGQGYLRRVDWPARRRRFWSGGQTASRRQELSASRTRRAGHGSARENLSVLARHARQRQRRTRRCGCLTVEWASATSGRRRSAVMMCQGIVYADWTRRYFSSTVTATQNGAQIVSLVVE
jgi:hypothetical protein